MPRRPSWMRGTPTSVTPVRSFSSGATSPTEASRQAVADVTGIVAYSFGTVNVAASQSNVQLYRMLAGSTAQANQVGVITPFRGSVVAMTLRASEAKTAGVYSVRCYIAGSGSNATLTWSSSTKASRAFVRGDIAFAENVELDLRYTTDAAFLPVTTDVEVILYVAYDPSTIV